MLKLMLKSNQSCPYRQFRLLRNQEGRVRSRRSVFLPVRKFYRSSGRCRRSLEGQGCLQRNHLLPLEFPFRLLMQCPRQNQGGRVRGRRSHFLPVRFFLRRSLPVHRSIRDCRMHSCRLRLQWKNQAHRKTEVRNRVRCLRLLQPLVLALRIR